MIHLDPKIFTSFIAVLVALPLLIRLAPRLGLLDRPDARKRHRGEVPLVGGLSLFVGLAVAYLVNHYGDARLAWMLGGGLLLVAVGFFDDRQEVSTLLRFAVQTAACLLMALGADVYLRDFGQLLWAGTLPLGWAAIPVTVFCVVGVTNALNMPSLSAEEAPKLRPYMGLAENLGSLVGQLAHGNLTKISIEREGAAAELSGKPIEGAVLAGLMRQYSDTVNMVNAPYLAKERGLDIRSIRHEKEGAYNTLLRVTVGTEAGDRSVAGTLFGADAPRLTEIFGVRIEAELEGHMLYIVNEDAPGFIGRIGSLLGENGINIGTFNLGRRTAGGEAVLLLSVDQPILEFE